MLLFLEKLAQLLARPLRKLASAAVDDTDEGAELVVRRHLLSLLSGKASDRVADDLRLRLAPSQGQALQSRFRLDIEPYGRHPGLLCHRHCEPAQQKALRRPKAPVGCALRTIFSAPTAQKVRTAHPTRSRLWGQPPCVQ